MVYFSCNTCGSSIKKNQVEKHCNTKCRNCRVLSCLDCGKDFIGDAYKEHTQCITEAEKYSAKGWQPKPTQNARANKQQTWMMAVKKVAQESEGANPRVRKLLHFLSEQEIIPRKRPKFENFLRNKNERPSQETIDEVWNLLSLAQEKLQNSTDGSGLTDTVSGAVPETGDSAVQEGERLSKKERKAERKRKQTKVEKKDVKVEKNDEEEERETKKKKHKHRHEEAEDDETVSAEQKGEEVVQSKKKRKHEEGEEGSKKKKKKKHYEDTEDALSGVKMNGEGGQMEEEQNAEVCSDNENDSRRKKKGKNYDADNSNEGEEGRKKKKHEEMIEDSGRKKKKQRQGEEDIVDVKQKTETCMQEDNSEDARVGAGPAKKFKWEGVIMAILQSKDGELSLKKLRKKVIAEYCARGGDGKGEKSMEKLWALFNKKVNKNPKFKVLKDKVKLVK